MTPELQKVVTDALVMIIPVFAAWVVAKVGKMGRDVNAAFQKLRAHEEELGIETKVIGGKLSVTSRPSPSQEGAPLDSGDSDQEHR